MGSIFSPLTKNIGIDLGTCTTQVYVEGRGIVLSEPSIMATDQRNTKIIAVGRAAEDMLTKSPETVNIHRPLQNGVIADYGVTRTMLGYILNKCVRSVQRLRIMVGVPAAASNVEKRAVMEAVYQAGAKEAFLIETAAAAAIGANMPVYDPVGNMVVDIGGGTTNIAMLSLGGIVVSKSIHLGSLEFNGAIKDYLRYQYAAVTDEDTIEEMKITNGSAVLPLEDRGFYFMGRGLDDGLQKELAVQSSELYHAIGKPLVKILDLVRSVLRETPPELAADIVEHGIVLTGGGAKLRGMDQLFAQELGVPVVVAAEPDLAVARGAGIAIAKRDSLSALIQGAQRIYRRRF
ncbi:rod shape-determining protein MreB [Megasphaera cerevisiae DSM 20462]|uniref:Cell shape-determining protein MreB n=1 Tax=Megasphaera cerevisiae DSM 20462 TaxID=1122219 RepID=A0A0J6WWN5_9FIRM|nr:rod shape-determining protein [Megasphaera cerevisiae]KMO87940.1 rod shape-determining protein MreB [Megasphaera cerevisiae DSM 20462]OKY54397.1 rod shape-determining protein [Megasphaera cerevisiae]SJZ42008.1 rod shape-determining protein MreB [Megasphaera cerevisiae DSM 20462]